jgi:hypothetical protein
MSEKLRATLTLAILKFQVLLCVEVADCECGRMEVDSSLLFIYLASQPLFPFWAWKLGSEVQGKQGNV